MNEIRLRKEIEEHPYPLLFVALSGAHLYGYGATHTSMYLHGVHVLPATEVMGLKPLAETVERCYAHDGVEMSVVSDDVHKFFQQIRSHNGYAVEQAFSPVLLCSSPEHEELRDIIRAGFSRHHATFYLEQAQRRIAQLSEEATASPESLLHPFRFLCTGLFLMQEGEIESNLCKLAETYRLTQLTSLFEQIGQDPAPSPVAPHLPPLRELCTQLEQARDNSLLPWETDCTDQLHDLLLRIRFSHLGTK